MIQSFDIPHTNYSVHGIADGKDSYRIYSGTYDITAYFNNHTVHPVVKSMICYINSLHKQLEEVLDENEELKNRLGQTKNTQ